jgi:hypothetical protein
MRSRSTVSSMMKRLRYSPRRRTPDEGRFPGLFPVAPADDDQLVLLHAHLDAVLADSGPCRC